MTVIDAKKPVMVTGGTGYIASWLIKYLLEAGHTVHATVRDPNNLKKVAHLQEIAKPLPGTLKLFQADLLSPGSFDAAMQGCELVIHTASPFIIKGFKDANEALVKPALQGTRHVLDAVNRCLDVKRVVLTSSVAAMLGDNCEITNYPNQQITEDCWNTSSSEQHQPYSYSKTVAEQTAWEIYKQQSRWDLVVINPVLVMGPALTTSSQSTSISTLTQFGDGTMRFGTPKLYYGIVDVRDVAKLHILAGFTPSASGRHIANGQVLNLLQIAQLLKSNFSQYPLPKRHTSKLLLKAVAPLVGLTRRYVARNVGYPIAIHSSKANALGLQYHPIEQTLNEHFAQLIEDGFIRRRRA